MMFFERVGGRFIERTEERVVATIPVVEEMLQTDGVINGGMSAYIAETVASDAAKVGVDTDRIQIMGMEVSSTHLLPVFEGDTVRCVATPVRRGGKTQVWRIEQYRESDNELFNVSQLIVYMKKRS